MVKLLQVSTMETSIGNSNNNDYADVNKICDYHDEI